MINYDYLDWGSNISKDDMKKGMDYKELEEMDLFVTDTDAVLYDEDSKENNEYNVWYLETLPEKPWGEDSDRRMAMREEFAAQIEDFAQKITSKSPEWEWRGGTFLDAFLLEEVESASATKYDSVLLLATDSKKAEPLAIVWEMVPSCKRALLMNLQKMGKKIFAASSDKFKYTEEGFVCVEIYIKN